MAFRLLAAYMPSSVLPTTTYPGSKFLLQSIVYHRRSLPSTHTRMVMIFLTQRMSVSRICEVAAVAVAVASGDEADSVVVNAAASGVNMVIRIPVVVVDSVARSGEVNTVNPVVAVDSVARSVEVIAVESVVESVGCSVEVIAVVRGQACEERTPN